MLCPPSYRKVWWSRERQSIKVRGRTGNDLPMSLFLKVCAYKNTYSHSALVSQEKGIVNIMGTEVFSRHSCVWYTHPVMVWWEWWRREQTERGEGGRKRTSHLPSLWCMLPHEHQGSWTEEKPSIVLQGQRGNSHRLSQVKESNDTSSLWWVAVVDQVHSHLIPFFFYFQIR